MNKEKLSLTQQIQSSSEGSLKEKRYMFIAICSLFTWFNKQIINLYHR